MILLNILIIILVALLGFAVGVITADKTYGETLDEAMEAWGRYIKLLGKYQEVLQWIHDLPVPYTDEAFLKHIRILHNDILKSEDEEEETCSSG